MKRLELKVCGLKEPENINDVVALDPQRIGFIFYAGSPRYVLPTLQPEELKHISGNTLKTGVFVNQSADEIRSIAERFSLDVLQLHGNESPELCAELNSFLPVVKAFGIKANNNWELISRYEYSCDLFLFDTASASFGGSGKRFNLDELKNYSGGNPYYIAGGIGFENSYDVVSEIRQLNDPRLIGLEVNSAVEVYPGLKNISLLTSFINTLNHEQLSR